MTRWALVLVAVAGCTSTKDTQSSPPRAEPPPVATPVAIDAAAVPVPVDAPVPLDAAVDAPTPDAGVKPKPAKVGCKADAKHCCMPDGRIIAVSGCDPLDGGHGFDRGGDGKCRESFCRCLPGDALIATPRGARRIDTLALGDLVYTADADGHRMSAPIIALASVPFDAAHPIQKVTLGDGRTFRASAGHPLVDGSLVGAVRVGASIDGAIVSEIRTYEIMGPTWDLRPAGPTGTYWADGVHLGSTLRAK
jgi:hypothetical protein